MPLHSLTIEALLSKSPFLTISTLAQTSGTETISFAETISSPPIFKPFASLSKNVASSTFHSPEADILAIWFSSFSGGNTFLTIIIAHTI